MIDLGFIFRIRKVGKSDETMSTESLELSIDGDGDDVITFISVGNMFLPTAIREMINRAIARTRILIIKTRKRNNFNERRWLFGHTNVGDGIEFARIDDIQG